MTTMFSNSQVIFDHGVQTFTQINEHSNGLSYLHTQTAHGAAHDSSDRSYPPRCHPQTRRKVIKSLAEWVNDNQCPERLLWLNGSVGVGKSAICQSFAESFRGTNSDAEVTAIATFFFVKSAARQNTARYLFATLAYQLAIAIPELKDVLVKIVEEDPSVVHKSIDIQLERLVIDPLRTLESLARPVLLIIDGLDECGGEDEQCNLIRLIVTIFNSLSLPIRIVLSSRPETWIRDELVGEDAVKKLVRRVSLDESFAADEDIRVFYKSSFIQIHDNPKHRHTMANVAKPWPSDAVVESLVEKASGQFVYASTVVKHTGDPNGRPTERLESILNLPKIESGYRTDNPFADLDQLYSQILSTCSSKKRTLDVLGTLLAMISAVTTLHLEWSPGYFIFSITEKLLDLKCGDVYLALRSIHSLVYVAEFQFIDKNSHGETVSVIENHLQSLDLSPVAFRAYHKSFIEFLYDVSRSGCYHIVRTEINTRLGMACVQALANGPNDKKDLISDVAWGYALLTWTYHCAVSNLNQTLLENLAKLNIYRFYVVTVATRLPPDVSIEIEKLEATRTSPKKSISRSYKQDVQTWDSSNTIRARDVMLELCCQNDISPYCYRSRLDDFAQQLEMMNHPPKDLIKGYKAVADVLWAYLNRKKPWRERRIMAIPREGSVA